MCSTHEMPTFLSSSEGQVLAARNRKKISLLFAENRFIDCDWFESYRTTNYEGPKEKRVSLTQEAKSFFPHGLWSLTIQRVRGKDLYR